nr:hypothetical protein [Anaerolineae bacterium]
VHAHTALVEDAEDGFLVFELCGQGFAVTPGGRHTNSATGLVGVEIIVGSGSEALTHYASLFGVSPPAWFTGEQAIGDIILRASSEAESRQSLFALHLVFSNTDEQEFSQAQTHDVCIRCLRSPCVPKNPTTYNLTRIRYCHIMKSVFIL